MELDNRKNEARNELKRQDIQHEVCRLLANLISRVLIGVIVRNFSINLS